MPLASSIQKVVTMEEGTLIGGFGSAIVELFNDNEVNIPVYRIGIPDVLVDHASPDQSKEKLGSIDNTLLFAVSIIPYAIFLFYLYKIKSVNVFVKTGFSLTVLFVFITILVSIFTLNYYDKTLVEVDFLHGFAESFLTLSDFVILFGFIKLLNSLEVNNS